jgi:hypothetical protein
MQELVNREPTGFYFSAKALSILYLEPPPPPEDSPFRAGQPIPHSPTESEHPALVKPAKDERPQSRRLFRPSKGLHLPLVVTRIL